MFLHYSRITIHFAPFRPSIIHRHGRIEGYNGLQSLAGVAELVDATDSKSVSGKTECGFESHLRHFVPLIFNPQTMSNCISGDLGFGVPFMCGRFQLSTSLSRLAQIFGFIVRDFDLNPRYNIAPTQKVAVLRSDAAGMRKHIRHLSLLRWGLVPHWSKTPDMGARLMNARCETLCTKPSFRDAYAKRRCLILTDGFYEWQKLSPKEAIKYNINGHTPKQPFYIRMKNAEPFAFAGLWEQWGGMCDGTPLTLETCTIVTTEPNNVIIPIHNRMPVIVKHEDYDTWLNPFEQRASALQPILKAYPSDLMEAYPVSQHINRPSYDDRKCSEPIELPSISSPPMLFDDVK